MITSFIIINYIYYKSDNEYIDELEKYNSIEDNVSRMHADYNRKLHSRNYEEDNFRNMMEDNLIQNKRHFVSNSYRYYNR